MNKINVTDARKDMSSFFDSCIFEKPLILKRRKYEAVLAERSLMKLMLDYAKIKVSFRKAKDKFICRAIDLDIIVDAETRVEAENKLCEELIKYASEVYDNFMFYFYGQNVKDKLPFIFHILLCDSVDEVKSILSFSKISK